MYGLIFIGIILFFTVLIIFISNYMIKELRYKRNMEEIERTMNIRYKLNQLTMKCVSLDMIM